MKRHCEQKGRIQRLGVAICQLYCRAINPVRLLRYARHYEKQNRHREGKARHCDPATFGGRINPLII